jgi:hypothetical protein
MTEKAKKVAVTEESLVNLIYNIVEKTIDERVEKGELVRAPKVPKTTKVTVTEGELAELVKTGRVLNVKKKA